MTELRKVSNYCHSCLKNTNHTVLKEHRWSSDPEYDYCYAISYQIVKCDGCDRISFRQEKVDFEDAHFYGKPSRTIYQYPISLKEHREFEWHECLEFPENVNNIYKDTIKCYANDSKILTGAGLRACIEAICNDKNIEGKDLSNRINQLKSKGMISAHDASHLHGIRFMGNDSVHDIKTPKDQELKVALRIVKHLLESIYILPKLASGTLKTTIVEYDDFLNTLRQNLQNFSSGDEFDLYKLLSEDFRRCQSEIVNFQQQLDSDIDSGVFTLLKKGKTVTHGGKTVQHYILT